MPRKSGGTDRKKWRKVDRIGVVTIYKRGPTYHLYYRENSRTLKVPVGRSLHEGRRMASQANSQLQDKRPSTFGFERIGIAKFSREWLGHCKDVQGLSANTLSRYRAAFEHFVGFAGQSAGVEFMDQVTPAVMEDFLRHMRAKSRTRNGGREKARSNPAKHYKESGIAFVLSTCRTAFGHAVKRRYLPPYTGNPCADLAIESMSKAEETRAEPFTPEQEAAFYTACSDWQLGIFFTLAAVGLRRDELRHLLISDVDRDRGVVHIRSKPELFWSTKTRRTRDVPIFPLWEKLLRNCIGSRQEGFVFLHEPFCPKPEAFPRMWPAKVFQDHGEMCRALAEEMAAVEARLPRASAEAVEKEKLEAVRSFAGEMGQLPPNRVRQEFMKLTKAIKLPWCTRAHDLRRLFATAMAEAGTDLFARRDILGHASLDMTGRYTVTRTETARREVEKALHNKQPVMDVVEKRLIGKAAIASLPIVQSRFPSSFCSSFFPILLFPPPVAAALSWSDGVGQLLAPAGVRNTGGSLIPRMLFIGPSPVSSNRGVDMIGDAGAWIRRALHVRRAKA